MRLQERLKQRRQELRLSQEELGDMVGIQKSAVAKYENGRLQNPGLQLIEKFAAALKCDPVWLMGWEDSPYIDRDARVSRRGHSQADIPALAFFNTTQSQQSESDVVVDERLLEIIRIYNTKNDDGRDDMLKHARYVDSQPEYKKNK
jgi:transcriptional regulator with XRE-family HTH domain